ncbi:MAG: Bifunctional polymyxin resistance protein ArnA [Lentisphaerae bacterium ADurb.BinA184]|nr:MAG: Bifunctional polymyxin resistance protein ArnA [Lentisphaerae bacterium ADurb.BinA184]
MRYLITGGAGFIGSHLAEALIEAGHEVAVMDDLSTGRMANLRRVADRAGFRFVQGNVESAPELAGLVEWSDSVFHLAAAVGVELVVRDPVRTIETNIHGSESVFACAARCGRRVLLASTSEVYGRAARQVFRETDDLLIGPPTHYRWSYAASKALDEFLALAYHKQRRLDPVIVRLFNTVGPRQTGRYGMVLPRFVASALRHEPLRVFGEGTQTRCFCHVADTVRALMLLEREPRAGGGIFNVGTSESISINDLAARVIEVTGSRSTVVHVPYAEAYEPGFEDMQRRVPDTAKLRGLTGWCPGKGLGEIIAEVRDCLCHEPEA